MAELKLINNPKLLISKHNYLPLLYIRRTGAVGPYIDTGISIINGYTIEIQLKLINTLPTYAVLFGQATTTGGHEGKGRFYCRMNSNLISAAAGNGFTYLGSTSDLPLNTIHTFNCSSSKFTLNGSKSVTFTPSIESSIAGTFKFGDSTIANSYCDADLYYIKIWDNNDELIQHLIPCIDLSDEEVCMFDLVTLNLFKNSGTNTFIAGPILDATSINFKENCTGLMVLNCPKINGKLLLDNIITSLLDNIILERIRIPIGTVNGTFTDILKYMLFQGYDSSGNYVENPILIGTWNMQGVITLSLHENILNTFGDNLILNDNIKLDMPEVILNLNEITITSIGNSVVYYTTNGNIPTTNDTLYTEPFNITQDCVISAIAVKSGISNSDVKQYSALIYQLDEPTITSDVLSRTVTITHEDEDVILAVSLDNGITWEDYPTSTTLTLAEDTLVKVKATKTGWIDSNIITKQHYAEFAVLTINSLRANYNPAVAIILNNNNKGHADTINHNYYLTREEALLITSISTWFASKTNVLDTQCIVAFDGTLTYPFESFNEFQYFTGITNIPVNQGFYDCTNLTSIILPPTLQSLSSNTTYSGKGPFDGCINLVVDDLSEFLQNLLTIGYRTFYNCTSLECENLELTSVTLYNGVFAKCTGIKNATINNSQITYGTWNYGNDPGGAFAGCSNLETVDISTCTLISPSNYAKDYINSGGLFKDCISLVNIILPTNMTLIPARMFMGCTSLPSITIPLTVTTIHAYAFSDCSNLVLTELPSSITDINNSYIFLNCSHLGLTNIDNIVGEIGVGVFTYANITFKLSDIPNTVTKLKQFSFVTPYFHIDNDININYAQCCFGATGATPTGAASVDIDEITINCEYPEDTSVTDPAVWGGYTRSFYLSGNGKAFHFTNVKSLRDGGNRSCLFNTPKFVHFVPETPPTIGSGLLGKNYPIYVGNGSSPAHDNAVLTLYQTSPNWATIYSEGRLKTWRSYVKNPLNVLFSYLASHNISNIASGTAEISKIEGNSLVFNQLVDTDTTEVETISGHKYRFLDSTNETDTIITSTGQTLEVVGSTDMVIDLTKMFGSGNEPNSVADFKALYPLDYYAHNEGEIVSFNGNKIKAVGFNQWDEEWELGTYNNDTGAKRVDNTRIRSKNFIKILPNTNYFAEYGKIGDFLFVWYYDSNYTYVGRDTYQISNRVFTTPANASYMTFATYGQTTTTYNHDICINLSWSGIRNGEYEPYTTNERELPIGKINTDGTITESAEGKTRLFPNGLLSAGTAHDVVTKNGADSNIGVLDIGQMDWEYDSARKCFYVANLISPFQLPDYTNNIVCEKYTTYPYTSYTTGIDKVIHTTVWHNIREINIFDFDFDGNVSAFKQAMNGVKIYIEYKTPTHVDFAEPLNLSYQVSDFGTEEILPENDDEPTTSPFKGVIIYP